MKTILLADDEVPLRTLVCTTLQDPSYRIVEASDGTSALAIAKREHLDLVILDWMLPDIDGIDIARILRQDPATARTPIIMLTARGQDKDQAQARALGIYAYLIKPFSPLELLGQVQAVLKPPSPETRLSIGPPETPDQTADVQRQLDVAQSQLVRYAQDLKRLLDAERRKSQELAEAHARLHILDRLKTDFLMFIAHELRTPLTHMNAIDLYDPHDEPQERAMLLDMIRSGYVRLEGFLQTGLEYFTWMATKRVDTQEIVDLSRLVPQVADQIPGLAAPGVDFQISTPGMPCRIRGEESHLSTVVQILLDNALKFSPQEKSIRVQLQATAAMVTLAVADRGQGFPPEFAGELFRPFTIADARHHSQGTGLNLALAHAMVEAYGGRIWAASPGVGKGATFSVELPALPPHPDVRH